MSGAAPIEAIWDGQVFRPASPYWVRRAAKDYAEGEILHIVDQPERSSKSHNHFFASVHSAWASLPPLMAERFHTPDALRKYALIKAGYCHSDSITCPSHADALRVAAFVRGTDEFAIVTVQKNMVTRYIAKSQSMKMMGKKDFQDSKTKVLEILADMLSVPSELLEAQHAA